MIRGWLIRPTRLCSKAETFKVQTLFPVPQLSAAQCSFLASCHFYICYESGSPVLCEIDKLEYIDVDIHPHFLLRQDILNRGKIKRALIWAS